jgi:hypothetical protein
MQTRTKLKKCSYMGVIILALVSLAGCSGSQSTTSSGPAVLDSELSPVSNVVENYGDIELPLEMVLDPDQSMSMRTDSFQGGILVYRGRVQLASLKDYLTASMRNHKWKLVGEASYKNAMLIFTKPNKTCMVVITEDFTMIGKTTASLYISADLGAGRLNPFGEPVKQ